MTTLAEIRTAILRLPPLERAELQAWLAARAPRIGDGETDSPELEAELLQVAEDSFIPYSGEELRSVCARVVREIRRP